MLIKPFVSELRGVCNEIIEEKKITLQDYRIFLHQWTSHNQTACMDHERQCLFQNFIFIATEVPILPQPIIPNLCLFVLFISNYYVFAI